MRTLLPSALALLTLMPAVATADFATFWAAGKVDYVTGTGDIYTNFESAAGFGAELGLELVGIDIWGEALRMGDSQFLFSGNIGIDLSFGDQIRFSAGAFTGPLLLVFPKGDVNSLNLSPGERDLLIQAGLSGAQIDKAEKRYNDLAEAEADLGRTALGWNIVRAQLNLEFKLAPVLFLGVGGEAGYHFLISGKDVAAGAKNKVVEDVVQRENLDPEAEDVLRNAVGAQPVDTEKLNGMNYQMGVYLKLEL